MLKIKKNYKNKVLTLKQLNYIKLTLLKYLKFNLKNYYFYKKSNIILKNLLNKMVYVYNGKNWSQIIVNNWNIGYKKGNFIWTRKFYLKNKKKKKKK